jgi:hypothetical protein
MGNTNFQKLCGLTEQPIKHQLECHLISLSMERPVICQLSWNSKLIGQSKDGMWTWMHPEQKRKMQISELERMAREGISQS